MCSSGPSFEYALIPAVTPPALRRPVQPKPNRSEPNRVPISVTLRNNSGNNTCTHQINSFIWKRLIHLTNYSSHPHYRESTLNIPSADVSTTKLDRSYRLRSVAH